MIAIYQLADAASALAAFVGPYVLAGLIALVEAALSATSRARAVELNQSGKSGAAGLLRIMDDPARSVSTLVLLRLVCEAAAIVGVALWLDDELHLGVPQTVLLTLIVVIAINFVVIDVGLRTLGAQHSDAIATTSAGLIRVLTRLFRPLLSLLILLGNAITPGKGFSRGPFAWEAELRELVDKAEASSLIESDEREMIHSVIELGDTMVREVMVPRTDVVYIEQHKTLRQAMSLFLRSGFSRVPVIDEDLDQIVGFAYLKDISKRVFDRQEAQSTELVGSLMRPVLHVPDTKPVDDLLRVMQLQRRHIAVAVDEYGGTAGILTIEDILEEIVGEIADEFDDEIGVTQLDDGSVRVSSRFPVDDLSEVITANIVEEEVESVGGLMAKYMGRVPLPGSSVEIGGLLFTAEEAKGRRRKVGTVRILRMPNHAPAADRVDD